MCPSLVKLLTLLQVSVLYLLLAMSLEVKCM